MEPYSDVLYDIASLLDEEILHAELLSILSDLNLIAEYSRSNAFMLKRLVERYDEIVEHLVTIDNQTFSPSVVSLNFIEKKLRLVLLKNALITVKRNHYGKVKSRFKFSVTNDLNNFFVERSRRAVMNNCC